MTQNENRRARELRLRRAKHTGQKQAGQKYSNAERRLKG